MEILQEVFKLGSIEGHVELLHIWSEQIKLSYLSYKFIDDCGVQLFLDLGLLVELLHHTFPDMLKVSVNKQALHDVCFTALDVNVKGEFALDVLREYDEFQVVVRVVVLAQNEIVQGWRVVGLVKHVDLLAVNGVQVAHHLHCKMGLN